jgi:hypothetical protein
VEIAALRKALADATVKSSSASDRRIDSKKGKTFIKSPPALKSVCHDSDNEVDADELRSLSSNEAIDSSDDEDDNNSFSSLRRTAPLKLVSRSQLLKKAQKQSALFLGDAEQVFPKATRVLDFPQLADCALSGSTTTGLMSYNIEQGIYSSVFMPEPGIHRRNLALRAVEFMGPANSPVITMRSRFVSHNGINYTPIGYPQTIGQGMLMLDDLIKQATHADSSLVHEQSRLWVSNLLEFKREVTILIQTLLPGSPDTPKPKHIVNRAAILRFMWTKANQSAVQQDPTLLNTDLLADWRRFIDPFTNGTVIKQEVLTAILRLSGYKCSNNACGALGENEHLCPSCKLSTKTSLLLFPVVKTDAGISKATQSWTTERNVARAAFKASPAGAAFRQLPDGDRSLYNAFIVAFPAWRHQPSSPKEVALSVATYDIAHCRDYLLKHQEKFDLPVGLRST